jgi:ferredoxin
VVTVDRDLCIGSGSCVLYAPATFAQDDEAKAYVVDPDAPLAGDDLEAVRTAVEACPTHALRMTAGVGSGADREGDAPCS